MFLVVKQFFFFCPFLNQKKSFLKNSKIRATKIFLKKIIYKYIRIIQTHIYTHTQRMKNTCAHFEKRSVCIDMTIIARQKTERDIKANVFLWVACWHSHVGLNWLLPDMGRNLPLLSFFFLSVFFFPPSLFLYLSLSLSLTEYVYIHIVGELLVTRHSNQKIS